MDGRFPTLRFRVFLHKDDNKRINLAQQRRLAFFSFHRGPSCPSAHDTPELHTLQLYNETKSLYVHTFTAWLKSYPLLLQLTIRLCGRSNVGSYMDPQNAALDSSFMLCRHRSPGPEKCPGMVRRKNSRRPAHATADCCERHHTQDRGSLSPTIQHRWRFDPDAAP